MASISKYGNLIGKRFSRLLVLEKAPSGKAGHVRWKCRCDCGNEVIATSSNLARGAVQSCGCLQAENRIKYGTPNMRVGWNTHCKHCGVEFRTISNKQVYCSDDCSFLDRLKKIDETGCLEWQGNVNNQGYGVLRAFSGGVRKMVQAHRYAWERVNGKIPDGLCICHKCDNPRCVNVEHFFLGTRFDNNKDKALKNRAGKRVFTDEERQTYSLMNRGERSKTSKLKEEDVLHIIAMKGKISQRTLAELYGVSRSCIQGIHGGRNWTYLKDNT